MHSESINYLLNDHSNLFKSCLLQMLLGAFLIQVQFYSCHWRILEWSPLLVIRTPGARPSDLSTFFHTTIQLSLVSTLPLPPSRSLSVKGDILEIFKTSIPLKSSQNCRFSNNFRDGRSYLIRWDSLNIKYCHICHFWFKNLPLKFRKTKKMSGMSSIY